MDRRESLNRWTILVLLFHGILWGSEIVAERAVHEEENRPEQSCERPVRAVTEDKKTQPAEKSEAGSSAPPSYQNLRYQENWSSRRRQNGDGLWHSLKLIPLSDDGNTYLSFGGQFRIRSEFWSDFAFGDTDFFDDTFGLLRVRLHSDLHLGSQLRLFVEGKSALATGRELPGGLRTLDVDSADLQNAFLDLDLPLENEASLTFRVGRQELQFGKQRLVSPLDWSNTRPRMFDGFRGILRFRSWRVDGFWSRFVRLRKYAFNNHDSGTDFFGLHASGQLPHSPLTLDIYWLGLEREGTALAGVAPGEERHTIGSRLGGKLSQQPWDFDLEAAYQFGHKGSRDIEAFMVASQLGYALSAVKIRPRLYLGFDFASGDEDPFDNTVQTFDQLFPLGHAYFGFIDAVGRKNIVDLSQGVSFQPMRRMSIRIDGHFFWRAEDRDALYNAGSGILREGAPGSSKRVGSEIDLTWRYSIDRHTLIFLGFSHFFAGDFIRETGPDKDIDFGYMTLQYTF
ncbi:MAG: alginate export family protein [Acidobacteriota bacterium]